MAYESLKSRDYLYVLNNIGRDLKNLCFILIKDVLNVYNI